MKIKDRLVLLVSIPRSFITCLKLFPFSQAMYLPIIFAPNVIIRNAGYRGSVVISDFSKRVYVGFKGSYGFDRRTYWDVSDHGRLIFDGGSAISIGSQIIVNHSGCVHFGVDFYCNADCIINSGELIEIGDNVLLGWNVTIIDGDGHRIIKKKEELKVYDAIHIGNHVWIASDVTILKGTSIGNDCVIASKALVSKKFYESNVLIGGTNRILSEEVSWEK